MSSFKKGEGNSKIERKIQKGKSWEENPKATSYGNRDFTTKEKSFIKSPYKFEKG